MESYSVAAVLSATDKNFTSSMKSAINQLEKVDSASNKSTSALSKIAGSAVAFKVVDAAVQALAGSVDGAVKRFDTMNQFPKVMQSIGFSSEQSQASVEKLSAGIDGLPTSLDAITGSTQQLALLTGDLDLATDSSIALNDAFLASGTSVAGAERGLIQYTQMLSKGTVDIVSWRTLQETMGPALREVADAFGFAGRAATQDLYKALQSGEITFSKFNAKLIELDGGVNGFASRAKEASAGIGTSFANLQTAMVKGVASVITATDNMLKKNKFGSIAENIDKAKVLITTGSKVVAEGIGVAGSAIAKLEGPLKAGATLWGTYKAAMLIQGAASSAAQKMSTMIDSAKKQYEAFKLSTQATKLQTEADNLAVSASLARMEAVQKVSAADELSAKAKSATKNATAANTTAVKLSAEAEKARAGIVKAGTALEKANAAAKKAGEAAEAAKTRAVLKGEKAEAAKAKALKAGNTNEKLNAASLKASEAATAAKTRALALSEKAEAAKAKAEAAGVNVTAASAAAEAQDAAATAAKTQAVNLSEKAEAAKVKAESAGVQASVASAIADGEATAATAASAAATEAQNSALTTSSALVAFKTTLLGGLASGTGAVTSAQLALNAAFTASPLGVVILSIAALTGLAYGLSAAFKHFAGRTKDAADATINVMDAYKQLGDSAKDAANDVQEAANAIEDNMKSHDSAARSIEQEAIVTDDLISKVEQLAGKESRSAAEKKELAAYTKSLNGSIDGLNLSYDEEADWLNLSTEAIRNKSKAYKEQQKYQEAESKYRDYAKNQLEVQRQLQLVEETRSKMMGKEFTDWAKLTSVFSQFTNGPLQGFGKGVKSNEEAVRLLDAAQEQLEQQQSELAAGTVEAKNTMVESQAAIDAATATSTQNQITSLKDLSAEAQAVSEELRGTWQSFVDQSTDMFTKFEYTSKDAFTNAMETLAQNQKAVADWATNFAAVMKRAGELGIDQGFLAELSTMTPESAALLADLQTDTDSRLIQLSESYAAGGGIGSTAFLESLRNANIPESVIKLLTAPATSRAQEINDAYAYLGRGSVGGMTAGTAEKGGEFSDTLTGVVTDGTTAATGAAGNGAQQVLAAILGPLGQIPTSTGTSMTDSTGAVTTGVSNMKAAAVTGFNAMSNETKQKLGLMTTDTKTGMDTMQTDVKSGMDQFESAVQSGMDGAKTEVSTGVTDMVNEVNTLASSFTSAGSDAAQGLANGINDSAGAAISAAQSLANQVAAIMRSTLDEHSPSRVTKKIGKYAGEGLGLGMLDELRYVTGISKRLAEAAVPIASSSRRTAYATHSLDLPNEMRYESEREITIHVPVDLDGRRVGYGSAKYVEEKNTFDNQRRSRLGGVVHV